MKKHIEDINNISEETYRSAFDRATAAMGKLAMSELVPINIDITAAVITVRGCLPKIRAVQVPEGDVLSAFNAKLFDDLETYALALGYAHGRYRSADVPGQPVEEMVANLSAVRDQLFADATALASRKIIDGARLGDVKKANGYHAVVDDVILLVTMLQAHETDVLANSAIKAGDLERIDNSARELTDALGQREQAPSVPTEAAETRQRAFTLFVNAYDAVRRAVSYIRWDQGDVDAIAPSIYAGKQRRKVTDPTPAPSPNAPPPVAAAPVEPAVAPGHPGGDPFTSH